MKRLTATICLTLAVLLGSAGMSWSVGLQKGLDAYKNKNYATALRELNPLAEQGYADAQYNLGQMYRRGQGVQQADKTAVKDKALFRIMSMPICGEILVRLMGMRSEESYEIWLPGK